jgi:hypothetical protein
VSTEIKGVTLTDPQKLSFEFGNFVMELVEIKAKPRPVPAESKQSVSQESKAMDVSSSNADTANSEMKDKGDSSEGPSKKKTPKSPFCVTQFRVNFWNKKEGNTWKNVSRDQAPPTKPAESMDTRSDSLNAGNAFPSNGNASTSSHSHSYGPTQEQKSNMDGLFAENDTSKVALNSSSSNSNSGASFFGSFPYSGAQQSDVYGLYATQSISSQQPPENLLKGSDLSTARSDSSLPSDEHHPLGPTRRSVKRGNDTRDLDLDDLSLGGQNKKSRFEGPGLP